MTRHRKKVVLGVTVEVVAGWIVYEIPHTLHHIPEAYAAWDTGTLLLKMARLNSCEFNYVLRPISKKFGIN